MDISSYLLIISVLVLVINVCVWCYVIDVHICTYIDLHRCRVVILILSNINFMINKFSSLLSPCTKFLKFVIGLFTIIKLITCHSLALRTWQSTATGIWCWSWWQIWWKTTRSKRLRTNKIVARWCLWIHKYSLNCIHYNLHCGVIFTREVKCFHYVIFSNWHFNNLINQKENYYPFLIFLVENKIKLYSYNINRLQEFFNIK